MKKKYKLVDFLRDFCGALRLIAIYFTFIYMWIVSCHYLVFNVNVVSGNACFYGGVAILCFHLQYKVFKFMGRKK